MNVDIYKQPHKKKKKIQTKISPYTKPLMDCNYITFPSLSAVIEGYIRYNHPFLSVRTARNLFLVLLLSSM